MNEQTKKINRVLKCCKVVKILSKISQIAAIIATALFLILGIMAIAVPSDKFDEGENGSINLSIKTNNGNQIHLIELTDSELAAFELTSSVPALQEHFNEMDNADLLKISLMTQALLGIIVGAAVIVIMTFINLSFKTIIEEQTPFSRKVLKKMLATFIVITAVSFFSLGLSTAVMVGFCCFALYTILDYGTILQIESDETL